MIDNDYEPLIYVLEHYDPDNYDDVLFVIKECAEGFTLYEVLSEINERFLDEPEIMLAAIEKRSGSLQYASERLQKIGINGIRKLAEEQKRKREINNARIDIKNKRLID